MGFKTPNIIVNFGDFKVQSMGLNDSGTDVPQLFLISPPTLIKLLELRKFDVHVHTFTLLIG